MGGTRMVENESKERYDQIKILEEVGKYGERTIT